MDITGDIGDREDDSGIESTAAEPANDSSALFIRISVPQQRVQKCLQFHRDESVWVAKQRVLATLAKDLKDGLNYGLYCPPINGRAGKFLDEERQLRDYPLPGPIGFLEFKYKRRVYKLMLINPSKLRQLRSKANLRQFIEAIKTNSSDKVIKFLNKGLDPNFHDHETGETPITLATTLSKPRNVLIALASGGAHLDFRARDGMTSIHKAAARGNYEAIKCLLDLGSSPNYKDVRGLTPLYYCVSNPTSPFCVEVLLHDHAFVGTADERGWCEIHQACKHGRVQHLEHLLFYGADMNARNSSGNTPLHVCAANNQESCARVLLFRGADKTAENYANQDAYQVAAIAGNFELAEVFKNFKGEDVVPFQEVPKFNDKRRSSVPAMVQAVLQRSRSDSRLNKSFDSKPPSPALSNNSLPHYASSHNPCESPHLPYRRSYDSDSPRSMSISSAGSSGTPELPAFSYSKKRLYPALPGRTFICVKNYDAQDEAELHLHRGDFVQVLSVGEQGYWEGKVGVREGWFPSYCVEEVHMRQKNQKLQMDEDAVLMKRQTLEALVKNNGENAPRTVVLQRAKGGYGFVLRGAKSQSTVGSNLDFTPTSDFPALQYLDRVDKGSMADKAGLRPGDFLLEINNESVVNSTHEHAVRAIKNSGDTLVLKVITVKPLSKKEVIRDAHIDGTMTLPIKKKDQLDRTLEQYDMTDMPPEMMNGSMAHMANFQNYDPNNKTASIRSRPNQRVSSVELEEIFSRQGHTSSPGEHVPVIHSMHHTYASPAEMKAKSNARRHGARGNVPPLERARSSPNLGPGNDMSVLASTVAIAQNELNRTGGSATYANVENSDSRHVVYGVPMLPQYASSEPDAGRTIGATVICTNEVQRQHPGGSLSRAALPPFHTTAEDIVIPAPPQHAPPLPPPKQPPAAEVVKINTSAAASSAVYANVSKDIQMARQESLYESSFRPGQNAKMNKPPPPVPSANSGQHTASIHQRTPSSGSGGYSAPYQHQVVSQTTVNQYQEPHVNLVESQTLQSAQQFMQDHPTAQILVTADIHTSHQSHADAKVQPQKTTIYIPEPDYDTTEMMQRLTQRNTESMLMSSVTASLADTSQNHSKKQEQYTMQNIPQQQKSTKVEESRQRPNSVQLESHRVTKTPPPPASSHISDTPAVQLSSQSNTTHFTSSAHSSERAPPSMKPESDVATTSVSVKSSTDSSNHRQSSEQSVVATASTTAAVGTSGGKPRTTSRSEPAENEVSAFSNAIRLAAIAREKRRLEEEKKELEKQINQNSESKPAESAPTPPPPAPSTPYQSPVPPPESSSSSSSRSSPSPPPPPPPPPPPAITKEAEIKPKSEIKSRPSPNLPPHIQKQIEENKRRSDSHAALMAAVAKRRNIVDQTDMDTIAESIETKVQRGKKLQSPAFKGDKSKTDAAEPEKKSATIESSITAAAMSQGSAVKSSKTDSVAAQNKTTSSATNQAKQKIEKTTPNVSSTMSKAAAVTVKEKAQLDMTISSAPINAMLTNYNYQKNKDHKPDTDEVQDSQAESIKAQAEKARRDWLLKRSHSNLAQKPEVEQRESTENSPQEQLSKESSNQKATAPTYQREKSVERNLPTNPSTVALGDLSKLIAEKASKLKYVAVDDECKTNGTKAVEHDPTPLSPRSESDSGMRASSMERQFDQYGNIISPNQTGSTKFYGGRSRANGTSENSGRNGHATGKTNGLSNSKANQNGQRSSDLPFDLPPPLAYSNQYSDAAPSLVVPPPPAFNESATASTKPKAISSKKAELSSSSVRNRYSRHLTNGSADTAPATDMDTFIPPPPLFDNMEAIISNADDAVSVASSLSTLSSLSSGDVNASHGGNPTVGSYSFDPASEEIYAEIAPPPPPGFDDKRASSQGLESEPVYEELNVTNDFIPPPVGFGVSSQNTVSKMPQRGIKHTKNSYRNKTVQTWTPADVADWLDSLQLSEHKQNFKNEAVDGQQLTKMGRHEFIGLGVIQVGHRMNMERAIKKLMLQQK